VARGRARGGQGGIACAGITALEFDILDAQPQALEQAHASAVEQRRDEPHRAVEFVQQRAHLRRREHHRQAAHVLGGDDLVQPRQLDAEHLSIEEQQRRLGLVLRRGRHRTIDRQVGEEGGHGVGAEPRRMALAVEKDVAPRPVHVRLLRAQRVVAQPQRVAQPVEQSGRCGGARRPCRLGRRSGINNKARTPGSLDRRSAARRNRICARSAAGGAGIRIHAEKFSPDKPPANPSQEGLGEGTGMGGESMNALTPNRSTAPPQANLR
jgi:hypothetical protein